MGWDQIECEITRGRVERGLVELSGGIWWDVGVEGGCSGRTSIKRHLAVNLDLAPSDACSQR